MKSKLLLVATVLAAALIAVQLTAASSGDSRLQIGESIHFVGPGTTAGTFAASGAVNDSGTVISHSTNTVGDNGEQRVEGTLTLTGAMGSITEEFAGTITGSAPHVAARGHFRIVTGTGAYADLRGQGKFLVVVDFSTNQLIRTDDGQAEGED
jgi:hypothetical protein